MSSYTHQQRNCPISLREDTEGLISKLQAQLNSTVKSQNIIQQQHTEIVEQLERTKHELRQKSKELENYKKISNLTANSQNQDLSEKDIIIADKDRIIEEMKRINKEQARKIEKLEKENQELKFQKSHLTKESKKLKKKLEQNTKLIADLKEELSMQQKQFQDFKTRHRDEAIEKIKKKMRRACYEKIDQLLLLNMDANNQCHLSELKSEIVKSFQEIFSCGSKTAEKVASEFIEKYPRMVPFSTFQEKLLLTFAKYLSKEKAELIMSQLDSVGVAEDQELQKLFFQIQSGNVTEEVEKFFDLNFPAYLKPFTIKKLNVVALMKKSIKEPDFCKFNADVESEAKTNSVRAMFHTLCADDIEGAKTLTVGDIVQKLVKKQKYETDGFFWNWRKGFW